MEYEIDLDLGAADQVGLRFRCENESQAEKIHRLLRTENFKVSRLMPSKQQNYTHFVYVTGTEANLRSKMAKVAPVSEVSTTNVAVRSPDKVKTHQTFKDWQTKFSRAVKQLNNESFRPIAATQEVNSYDLDRNLELTSEIEERLVKQINSDNSNALRALITLYTQTDRQEQVIELWKSERSKILALPVSGRLVEQLVTAHIQYSHQTNTAEALCSAQQIAQEFLPELERLRQANGVRQLLHQALKPQELPPTIVGATLNEQLVKLLEIEPGERIDRLESLHDKYPKASNVLLALAESYTAIGKTDRALKIYQSIPEQTEEIVFRQLNLLIDRGQFHDVLSQLPKSIDELSPILSGLRGIALDALGEKAQARQFLEKAWNDDRHSLRVLLALARIWTRARDFIQAGMAYQILQESGNILFRLEDYILMARVASFGGFGDLSNKQKREYYKKCNVESISYLLSFEALIKIAQQRVRLLLSIGDIELIVSAYIDWVDRSEEAV
jgi:tetratricopeptide (TPR) repeat protein